MELLKHVGDISKIGYGFIASKALFTALDLDLFTRLARARASVEGLAAEAEVAPDRLQLLLTLLRALGLIGVDVEGKHYNSPAASSYLASASPMYFGDYFRFQIDRQFYPILTKLAPAIRGAESTHFYSEYANPEEAQNFSKAQHVGSLGAAHLLARRLGTVPWRSLLDVAGGTGAFSIMLCKRNPLLSATILDFPNVCEISLEYLQAAGVADRVSLLSGDARLTDWPQQQDAVLVSYLLSAISELEVQPLIDRAFAALIPGGALMIHDFMVHDDRSGPLSASLWILTNAIMDPRNPQLTPSSMRGVMERSGFADVQHFELLPGITQVVMGHKPH
ncbi:MAG: methyltransferase [Caldimonas sp.]